MRIAGFNTPLTLTRMAFGCQTALRNELIVSGRLDFETPIPEMLIKAVQNREIVTVSIGFDEVTTQRLNVIWPKDWGATIRYDGYINSCSRTFNRFGESVIEFEIMNCGDVKSGPMGMVAG